MDLLQNNFNEAISSLLVSRSDDGTLHGKVCICCDRFLGHRNVYLISVNKFSDYSPYLAGDDDVPTVIRCSYRPCFAKPDFGGALLSPRSQLVYKSNSKRGVPHVMCCGECRSGLDKRKLKQGKLPRFAIANGWAIGDAPECLKRLNEIELALVSQTRQRAHLFTYWGGCHRSIRGWHTFYKADPDHTTAVLNNVRAITESEEIAVVLCGPITKEQRQKIIRKTQVNVGYVNEAFQWLKENNVHYENYPLPTIGQPVIIDQSREVESENTDIETKELITVVFPDGTVNTGGADDGTSFEEALADMRSKCPDIPPYLESRPSKEILRDYEDDNLMKAFPLQFPYGVGLPKELIRDNTSLAATLSHLLYLSRPSFHEACFTLVVHNMFEKWRALKGSIWRVMGSHELCDASEEEINAAILRQKRGVRGRNDPGEKFLKSIKCVKKNLAHSNEAAMTARSQFLSLTHHFGIPKILFTVSFEDGFDIRILAMSGRPDCAKFVQDMENMPPDKVEERIDELGAIRCSYPGLCALNFEFLLDIVLECLVGDNESREGIFGIMDAYGASVEEQGRKTLHGHIIAYIRGWNKLLHDLSSRVARIRKAAEVKVCKLVDEIISTELCPDLEDRRNSDEEAASTSCSNCDSGDVLFATTQELRYLRHKHGCQSSDLALLKCSTCGKAFTGDDVATMRSLERPIWDLAEHQRKAVLKRDVLLATLQDPLIPYDKSLVAKVNCLFNHHFSGHTRTCFKKGDECRAYLPDMAEEVTRIIRSEHSYELYAYTGKPYSYRPITIRPKRLAEDAYTNCYSPQITMSRAPSNSNVSITTGARSCIYTTCYSFKATQKEDTQELSNMLAYVSHRFIEERKNSVLFEGISRLMGASIVATSEHVVAAPMAAYLVRNGSRFKCSHRFKYVPAREVVEVLLSNKESLRHDLMDHKTGCFLSNDALHYLLRPKSLEDMSLFEFNKQIEVVRIVSEDEDDAVDDVFDIDDEEHPGFGKQIYRYRSTEWLPQFSHWFFPDAATFEGSLWELNYPVNASVERYCRSALVLFYPLRTLEDITINGSHFLFFRKTFSAKTLPAKMRDILSNVQMFYNSMRTPARDDPVFDSTDPYVGKDKEGAKDNEEEEDDTEFFDGFFEMLEKSKKEHQESNKNEGSYCFDSIRDQGYRRCGYKNLPEKVYADASDDDFVVEVGVEDTANSSSNSNNDVTSRDYATAQQLMRLVYANQRRRIDVAIAPGGVKEIRADGSAESIVEWSLKEQSNLDDDQQVAFQIAAASFVLTYYDDAIQRSSYRDAANPATLRVDVASQREKLRRLTRLKLKESLRMYLDGPGGAGKSRVLTELLLYGEAFVLALGLRFDMRTIIVSAMSGVAAVSIKGETTHSVAFLNSNIPEDDVSWANARLLIIDEISFMNTHDLEKLDQKLRDLMRNGNVLYGGLNVIFCGDFRQLEPCTGKPLYSSNHAHKKWVHSINSYVELKGTWRFKDDPEWGQILSRLRSNTHTMGDIDAINECSLEKRAQRGEDLPAKSSYCVYSNRDRSAINAGMFNQAFEEHSSRNGRPPSSFVLVKASHMNRKQKSGRLSPLTPADCKFIYESCSDSRVTAKTGRGKGHFVAPLLQLHKGQPLMLVSNEDVPNGHANGTRVILDSVVLRSGTTSRNTQVNGRPCRIVDAEQVDYLLCRLEEDSTKTFKVRSKNLSCSVVAPIPKTFGSFSEATIKLSVQMLQFPLVTNYATTGHKLQGQTKESLVIAVWSKRRNWNYVALSRVQTRQGLYLVNKLSYDADFSIPPELTQMMTTLRRQLPVYDVDLDLRDRSTYRSKN